MACEFRKNLRTQEKVFLFAYIVIYGLKNTNLTETDLEDLHLGIRRSEWRHSSSFVVCSC